MSQHILSLPAALAEAADALVAAGEYNSVGEYVADLIRRDRDHRTRAGQPIEQVQPGFDAAVKLVRERGFASASQIQRTLGLSYSEAAALVQRMEAGGIVTAPDADGRRDVVRAA